jgi:ferredoxin
MIAVHARDDRGRTPEEQRDRCEGSFMCVFLSFKAYPFQPDDGRAPLRDPVAIARMRAVRRIPTSSWPITRGRGVFRNPWQLVIVIIRMILLPRVNYRTKMRRRADL